MKSVHLKSVEGNLIAWISLNLIWKEDINPQKNSQKKLNHSKKIQKIKKSSNQQNK